MLNPLQNLLLQVKPSGGDAAGLRPGQVLQATVQGEPGNLFLQLGDMRVPLRNLPQLFAGQVVDANILKVQPSLELQLTPRSIELPLSRDLSQALNLKPGATAQAIVQQGNSGRFVQVGSIKIPLPADAPFTLGQGLQMEAVTSEGRPALRLTAPPPPASPALATPQQPNAPASTLNVQQATRATDEPPLSRIPLPATAAPPPASAATMLFRLPIEQDAKGLFFTLGQERVGLPEGHGLAQGQQVLVQVAEGKPSPMALVWPAAAEPAAGTATTPAGTPPLSGSLSTLLNNVLQVIGRDISAEEAAPLLPRHLPQTETAVRQLLTVFAGREQMSADLGRLSRLIATAGALGGVRPEAVTAFHAAVDQFTATEAEGFRGLLRQLGETRSPEARIALALQSGQPEEMVQRMAGELRSQVAALQNDENLLNVLRSTRQADAFQEAVQRVLDRAGGSDLQNVRSLEQPYLFLNVPLSPDQPLRRVQVHFFNDGQRKRQFDRDNATIALDLETEQLGAMWVSLRIARGRCVCRFNADSAEAVSAIRNAAPELEGALQEAGYPTVRVEAELWEGDRLQEVSRLMRRFAGLDAAI